jgi:hypothetical protein
MKSYEKGMQKTMTESNKIPHLLLHEEVDLTELVISLVSLGQDALTAQKEYRQIANLHDVLLEVLLGCVIGLPRSKQYLRCLKTLLVHSAR